MICMVFFISSYTGKMCFLHNMEKLCNLFKVLSSKDDKSDKRMIGMEIIIIWRQSGEYYFL